MATRKKIGFTITRKAGSRNPPASCAAASSEEHPDVDFRRANKLFDRGQFPQALACYDRVIARVAGHIPAITNRGSTYAQCGQFQSALADFNRALELQPDNAEIHCMRAGALRALNRYDEMLAAYDEALRLHPGFVNARFRRGVSRLLTGRFREGWKDYEARWDEWTQLKAIPVKPRHC